jgi:Holliday junction resolvase
VSVQRAKGTRFEVEVVEYLRANGFPHVERRAMAGTRDTGDIAGLPGWVIEVKNTKTLKLGEFVAEAEKEAKNAALQAKILHNMNTEPANWAVVHKRRQHGAAGAYVTLSLAQFAELLAQ